MERDPGQVFAIPDLWAPSNFLIDASGHTSFLFSDLTFDDIDAKPPTLLDENKKDDGFFSIPDLSFGPAEDVPTPNSSPEPDETIESLGHDVDPSEDIDFWLFPEEIPLQTTGYQSWDGFENPKFEEPPTPYLTEAGPTVFDDAVSAAGNLLVVGKTDSTVIDARIYLSSLLALGLGRNSVLFAWNEEKRGFIQNLPKLRISGYTGESLDHLLVTFMECGNITRSLRDFIDKIYSGSTSPSRIALADAVSTLLTTIQSRLSASATKQRSILQLQSLFWPTHTILICFQRIIRNTSATRSDESMLSTIFEEIQLLEHRTDSLRNILLEILSRVSQPWLEFVSEWLGLRREAGLSMTKEGKGKSFVNVDNKEWVDDAGVEMTEPDYILDYDKVPAFIAPDDARSMFEVGRSLRFLRAHHTDHPLSKADIIASANPPLLRWNFSWQEIVQVEAKALQYETDLKRAIQQFSVANSEIEVQVSSAWESGPFDFKLELFGQPEENMQAHVIASIDSLDQPLVDNLQQDRLSMELDMYLAPAHEPQEHDESIFAPPISLAPVLSFNPIITAQARIVNGTCMRLFFKYHKLREHLSLQRSFQLLGNGVFSSRLSHALFDPELESAERHRGVARSGGIMGLRLGTRDNWPPASSELRLTLMGVLTESYVSTQPLNKSIRGGFLDQTSLPGDLSFAVRDMSQEEIDACLNPDSVEALDFLRLSYKPPAPLEAVITPIILYKYDQLFKLLLRVIRMLYIVSALFRDAREQVNSWQGIAHIAQRFRIEADHFVSSVSGYFFDTGIEATWRTFERKLDQIEKRIDNDEDISLGQNEGLDKLRDYHERVLDRIMFALLLRKRQQPVLKLLEEIFTLILQFSKHSRERTLSIKQGAKADEEVRDIYAKFKKKVGVFVNVCKGLSDKKGYGEKKSLDGRNDGPEGLFDGNDLGEENTITQLLSRLEMSNYYSKAM